MSAARGFSLLEGLISIALLAGVLLGVDALEWTLLRQSRSAYLTAVAVDQLQRMADEFTIVVTASARAQALIAWNAENQTVLPEGQGEWTGATLTLCWRDAFRGTLPCLDQSVTPLA